MEVTITGTMLDDLLNTALVDIMNGFTGNDTFIGSLSADHLNGGKGSDTADYSSSAEASSARSSIRAIPSSREPTGRTC